MIRAHLSSLLALLAALVLTQPVSAHALGAECKIRGDRVELTAFYDDDTPAIKAKVVVVDADKQPIAHGSTDAKGMWSFAIPPAGHYRATVDAGTGHIATIKIRIPAKTSEREKVSDETQAQHIDHDKPAETVSDGPSRAEFTRIPWGSICLGLGLIAGLTVGGIVLLRLRHPTTNDGIPEQ